MTPQPTVPPAALTYPGFVTDAAMYNNSGVLPTSPVAPTTYGACGSWLREVGGARRLGVVEAVVSAGGSAPGRCG